MGNVAASFIDMTYWNNSSWEGRYPCVTFQAFPSSSHEAGAVGSKFVRSNDSKPPAGADDEIEEVAEIVGGGGWLAVDDGEIASYCDLCGNAGP